MLKWCLPALMFVFITPKPVFADATLHYVDQASGHPSVKIAIHANKTFITNARGQRINALYNATTNALTLLDRKQKSYTTLGRDAGRKIQRLAQALSSVQHGLSQLFTNAAPETKHLRITATGRIARRGEHTCQVLDARMNGLLMSEICIAPAHSLGISATDAATLKALGGTVHELATSLAPYLTVAGASDFLAQGQLPFKVSHASDGKTHTDILEKVSSKKLASSLFTIPTGYRERSLATEILSLSQSS